MLNILKYDFYKIVKSRKMYYFYIFAVFTIFLMILINFFLSESKPSASVMKLSCEIYMMLIVAPMFAALLAGLDFSNKYIKNVYTSVNKYLYILSKVIYLLLFSLAYVFLQILLNWIFGWLVCGGLEFLNEYEIETGGWKKYFLCIAEYYACGVACGSVSMMIVYLLKKSWLAIVAYFIYWMWIGSIVERLANRIYDDEVVWCLFPIATRGRYNSLLRIFFEGSGGGYQVTVSMIVAPFSICLCWLIFSYFASVFAFKYRKV